MIKKICISGLLIITTLGFSQSDFSIIDKKAKTVPDSLTDYKAIANYLTQNLSTDKDKARALYIWIAHNITYDLSIINSSRVYVYDQDIIDEAIYNRKGVCQHYASLFLEMGKTIGLKTYLITGYTRDGNGKIADLSHAWNGIKIDTKYYLVDVTWSAGYVHNGKYVHKFRDDYFLKSPQDFLKDHMPFDPIWQFVNNPLNNDDFTSKNFLKLDKSGNFKFEEAILQRESLTDLELLEHSNERIMANGITNKLIQKTVDDNNNQIANRKYNSGIETLNNGINAFNLFVSHKNRQFKRPNLSDTHIQSLINDASDRIYAANDIFNALYSSNNKIIDLIADARSKMPDLISNLEKEKAFVDKYLKKWKPLRGFMFY